VDGGFGFGVALGQVGNRVAMARENLRLCRRWCCRVLSLSNKRESVSMTVVSRQRSPGRERVRNGSKRSSNNAQPCATAIHSMLGTPSSIAKVLTQTNGLRSSERWRGYYVRGPRDHPIVSTHRQSSNKEKPDHPKRVSLL